MEPLRVEFFGAFDVEDTPPRDAGCGDEPVLIATYGDEIGRLVRRHWSVEDELHWVLDVAIGEDSNRTATGPWAPPGCG